MINAATQDTIPSPALERRDDMGRLVAMTWHGAGADADTGSARWLVAVDGSACSLRAVAMVAGLATQEKGAAVDLVHVQPWLNKEAAETELPRRGWAATAQARQLLDAAAVRWRLHVVMGEGAPEIASLADALGSRGIAIGSRGLTATESLLLGSVAYRVVHLARLPVLIVR
ncbi:MAG: universal stress protein [Polaromonas sp.]|uniref:universal stress protein n=1 Tax=Polaromonas sp. TaxID=1869339 RepID=UPI00272F1701|nr:universal stress protein [Polaromonas sp.]MDP2449741.1 universal stress protein [Polaromonas sp.]MDP3249531.1 universal stress protein [Polaromonas sp.]MDP3757958.1 universal stress protein [Polaromonas sp.]MDP3826221.1 universal stress protein [Polaromonas sp.]